MENRPPVVTAIRSIVQPSVPMAEAWLESHVFLKSTGWTDHVPSFAVKTLVVKLEHVIFKTSWL